MHVCLGPSICLNVVGPSVSQVPVIRMESKSHQADPLISHLAWWTPSQGTTEGRHVPLCLSFSLTLSVCLSVHDHTCLSLNSWRALSVKPYFFSIITNKYFSFHFLCKIIGHGYQNWTDSELFPLSLTGTTQCHYCLVCQYHSAHVPWLYGTIFNELWV